MDGEKTVFVVSDSTGETADKAVQAALKQFPGHEVEQRMFARVRDKETIRSVVAKAHAASAMIVFTLVDPELREFLHQEADNMQVETADVIGSLIHTVARHLTADPLNTPTEALPLSETYYRRVEALEFAVRSDDGREPQNFWKADLVIVGVSRTSKTPLATYLAGKGLRVANVTLALGVEPPRQLFEIPQDRVVALTIGPEPLIEIRRKRLAQLDIPENESVEERVQAELKYAEDLIDAHPQWRRVDVTNRAIEETASIILATSPRRSASE